MSGTLERREATRDPQAAGEPRDWVGHVIVCGLHDIGLRTVEQIHLAGARVVVLDDSGDERFTRLTRSWGVPTLPRGAHTTEPLFDAGIAGAAAVVCAESSDLRTLETVLLVRDVRPDVRVVAHLDNPAVANAVEEVTGAATVLDVASLFAPSVIEVCTGRRAHDIDLGSTKFVTVETTAPRAASLRELYGSLAPLGVVTQAKDELIVCPGRDLAVEVGDRVTLIGTEAELEAADLAAHSGAGVALGHAGARALHRVRHLLRAIATEADRALRIALGLGFLLLVVSTLVLHFAYRQPHGHGRLSLLDAVYFTVETVATVGFGDFSFSNQPHLVEAFGIALIVAGTTLVTTLFALLTNALVSRRIAQSLGQAKIPGMRGHVVMIGLGSIGMEVLDGLLRRGREVVVVERDETNRYLSEVRRRGVPLVLGDATLGPTLEAVNLGRAAAVAILTSDDLTNIETGLAVRDRLGERWFDVPVVLRVFDRQLGRRLEESFAFRHVWSTVAIAAPWFVGATLGLEVLFSFYVGSHPFLIARLPIAAGGGLEGSKMSDLSAGIRVVAIARAGEHGALEHPPRRDTQLQAGDDAYLAGPYEELLSVLRRERAGAGSGGAGAPRPV
ncbi:MAG: NAD-binding protein [Solirubrobacteraceae bacterium]|jgi:Trk K+ transport system NAD-binding subunit/multidrug transporter EmrE-like cation transporter